MENVNKIVFFLNWCHFCDSLQLEAELFSMGTSSFGFSHLHYSLRVIYTKLSPNSLELDQT